MKNALNSVKIKAPTNSSFDLSHAVKMSIKMGYLYPCLALECVPGDRFRLGCENIIRMAPMLAPMMHRVDVRIEYFFVPNRLLWSEWETYITNGGSDNVQVDPLPAFPFINYSDVGDATHYAYGDFPILDYMGLPDPNQCPLPSSSESVSAMPFAAYQMIWAMYYRDENLQSDEGFRDTGVLASGINATFPELLTLRKRAWEADYFTKALPFAQKGAPVDVPVLTDGIVTLNASANPQLIVDSARAAFPSQNLGSSAGIAALTGTTLPADALLDPNGTLEVDIASTTINDLRIAYRLQEWLEKNARGGTRYSEMIRVHFNEFPQDSRLDRPEYIVGVKNPIQISEVLNTTGTDDAPQGNMAGHGISYNKGNYGKYHVREHGYIIGILSVMPKTAYQQGIPKHFLKITDPTELAWPTFANLGEQEIVKREIMAFQTSGSDVWGYTPRYMEYKSIPDRVAGEFKTNLDFWHMGRIFDPVTPPLLNDVFVQADPTKRIFAVEDEDVDNMYCQLMHHIMAVRPLPFYGTPTF